MEPPKKQHKLLNSALVFVRGPFFLSVVSVVLLLATIPAQATLLRGYLSSSGSTSAQTDTDTSSKSAGDAQAEESTTENAAVETHQSASAAAAAQPAPTAANIQQALLSADSFPPSFVGAWKCVTVVVASGVNSVPTGERVESEVQFVRHNDGRVVAHWQQPGWNEAQSSVMPVSDREAAMERTNYFVEQGMNGGWQAHSRDHYLQVDSNRIAATSSVEQYIDGQFLGQYRTSSMLYRMPGSVAYAPQ